MKQQPNNERPADLAVQDSVGGMARRLLDPAHLRDLARRSAATLREQGAEQLWRDVTFRVGLAFHHDDWRHRADLPLRRTLKAQRAAALQGPCISVVVPVYNTPLPFFKQMVQSVRRQTYANWQLVLVDASDEAHGEVSRRARQYAARDSRILCPCWTTTTCFIPTRFSSVCRLSKKAARILSTATRSCSPPT